jgi:hypothetical protein
LTAERHRDRGTPVSPAALARAWSDLLRPEYGGGVERSYVKHVFDGSRYVQAEHLPGDVTPEGRWLLAGELCLLRTPWTAQSLMFPRSGST